MADSYDSLETRAPEQRERELMARLPALVARAQGTPGWGRILAGVTARDIDSRAALAQLPVTRKSGLHELQQAAPPFGGLNATPVARLGRVFMSPGPIYDPEGRATDWWRYARPLHAAGVRPGALIQNCFSYHFTPAASMIEGAAARLGCAVIPAGSGQTEMQVQAMTQLRPDTYAGTPSFLKIILERAHAMGADVSSIRRAVLGAEALPASLRDWFRAHGIAQVFQNYGSADAGCIAYETASDGALCPGMVLDEDVIVEIVCPGSGEPVAPGDTGEVLVTVFNDDYPLIRLATGDLSAVQDDGRPSPCGRTNTRIRGWLGRADQATKVRALFVHPSQVLDLQRRHPEILRARLVISGRMAQDIATLHCEVADPRAAQAHGDAAIVVSMRELTRLRAEVRFAAPGSLPDDGKIIDDIRDYA